MAKAKKPTYSFKIRTYPNAFPANGFVSCWILRHDGAAISSLLFGEITLADAEQLAAALNLPVERGVCEVWQPGDIKPIKQKEATLFDAQDKP